MGKLVYAEVNAVLSNMNKSYINKIPKKLLEVFEKSGKEYNVKLNPNKPLLEQNLKRETIAILAMINLEYWCKDENHKNKLKEIYTNNTIINENRNREIYNPDDIFEKINHNENKEVALVEVKENWFTKIKKIIARVLRK